MPVTAPRSARQASTRAAGRPVELTPEREAALISAFSGPGMTRRQAADSTGVPLRTLMGWLARGEAETSTPFARLYDAAQLSRGELGATRARAARGEMSTATQELAVELAKHGHDPTRPTKAQLRAARTRIKQQKRLALKRDRTRARQAAAASDGLGWDAFFAALRRNPSIVRACETAGISPHTERAKRKEDPAHAALVLEAQADAYDALEGAYYERAKIGHRPGPCESCGGAKKIDGGSCELCRGTGLERFRERPSDDAAGKILRYRMAQVYGEKVSHEVALPPVITLDLSGTDATVNESGPASEQPAAG